MVPQHVNLKTIPAARGPATHPPGGEQWNRESQNREGGGSRGGVAVSARSKRS